MTVHVEQVDSCAVVRLDSGKVNAMDLALCDELTGVFSRLPQDPSVRAVVLTGNGRTFCAGVDLPSLLGGDDGAARAFVTSLGACFEAVLRCPLPVVAAVEGHAIAGGCVLMCAADLRVVVDDPRVRLGLTELAVGVPFPTSAVEIMRWRLGETRLAQRVLLADTVAADTAVAAGLADVSASRDDVVARALTLATSLAAVPSEVFRLTKAQLQADVRERIATRSGTWEAEVHDLWSSEPVRASLEQFVARTLRR